VDDAFRVGRFERRRDLARDGQSFVEWNRAFFDALRKRGPFHQLHHEIIRPHVVERADIDVIQRSNRTCLALKSLTELLRGDFDCDVPAQPRVACTVDFAHASGANLLRNLVRPERSPAAQ
jgi:hypothetical protein